LFEVVGVCLLVGFLSSHSYLVAVLVELSTLLYCWFGGWFGRMDAFGLAMLVLPACFAVAGALWGARRRGRRKLEDEVEFVAPPPPKDWRPRETVASDGGEG